jgi:transporter family-2 protein
MVIQNYFIVAMAGLMLPLQIAFNNKLTAYSGSPILSSLISFSVGGLTLLLYSISKHHDFGKLFQQMGHAPLYAWMGGLIGSFYVVSTLIASPKIGMAVALGLIIASQLIMSLVLDHFGWLGAEVKTFTWVKGMGLLLVLLGILLIKK